MRTTLTVIGILACMTLATAAERCELVVNDVSGVEAWPLVGGLPLPEGLITDPAHIRVIDADGNEVPCQADVATTYRDGSVRWALMDCQVDVPAGSFRATEYGLRVQELEEDGSYEEGEQKYPSVRVWLSDDLGIAVRLEAQVFVGHIYAELVGLEPGRPAEPLP